MAIACSKCGKPLTSVLREEVPLKEAPGKKALVYGCGSCGKFIGISHMPMPPARPREAISD